MDMIGIRRDKTVMRKKGFTLLEVLVTVSIISVITAASIVSLGNLKQKKEVEGDARRLAASIREAQNYALTGRNIFRGTDDVPCMFQVRALGTSYTLEQSNAGSCSTFGGEEIALSDGVTFGIGGTIRFRVPRSEPLDADDREIGEPGAPEVIEFVLTKKGTNASVCVHPLGRVEEGIDGC